MCTVTFNPRDTGYYLAMNRDEQLKRIAGLPPQTRIINGRTIVCPSEPGGGTWISLNDARVCFALINWYAVPARVTVGAVSRGDVVKMVSPSCGSDDADHTIASLPLNLINPFRLIGVFPDERKVVEWRWDLKKLVRHNREWEPQQWISSGYDEPVAQIFRGATFQKMRQDSSAGTLEWLRRLHGSHLPEPGAFSMCMHRADAGTVSYTEIISEGEELGMNYRGGYPCRSSSNSSCFLTEPEAVSRLS